MPSPAEPALPDTTAPGGPAPVERSGWANDKSLFAGRVAFVFATKIAQFVLGAATLFVIARLLGVLRYGEYGLLLTWVGMLFAVGQLGMPAAMTYMAGRGKSVVSLERIALGLTIAISVVLALAAIIALPLLRDSVLRAFGQVTTSDDLLRAVLISLPCQLLMQFAAGILYTRGYNRAFNRIQVAQAALMLILTLLLVGVIPLGVPGAVAGYLIASCAGALAAVFRVRRLARLPEGSAGPAVAVSEFVGYGIRLYPQNVMSFFNYRVDVLLLSWLLGDAMLIGYYVLTVRLAEMTFYVPDSISAMLYPAISASERHEADRFAPAVSRFTMLATALAAVAIIPAAFAGIWLFLPDYKPAFPALLVIMPGIVSLSLSKVLASYIVGLGRPLPTAVAAVVALTLNIAANLILIPAWGIVGASASSLISYTCHALILLVIASRMARVSPLAFLLPGAAEFGRVRRGLASAMTRVRASAGRSRPAD
ncbi:MAG: polysaccharide biosynthesis C-terminal domain-containing protein [Candidatus Limnocylindrales bacterium]